MKRLTTEEFIEKAQKVHGDKFIYDQVEYKDAHTKIPIICKEHGIFWQEPSSHLIGKGCPKCALEKKSQENKTIFTEFIKKANIKHNNKYTYDEYSYYHRDEKGRIKIICPEHGEFWQTPNNHLKGKGCIRCRNEKLSKLFAFSNETFKEQARRKHGDKYTYDKVEYKNNRTPVCIICPEHGEFWQTPANHLKYGCQECGGTKKKDTQKFIQDAQKVHQDRYNYDKTEYKDANTRVKITCLEHGEFWQTPNNHLQGQGCPKCAGKNITTEEYIKKVQIVHQNKYRYTSTMYRGAKEKLQITCPEHGNFWQIASAHLEGCGCPECKKELLRQVKTMPISIFVDRATTMHNNKYDYSKVDMYHRDSKGRVCIICPEHGEFWQNPFDHLNGKGCPKCQHQQSKPEQEIIEYLKQFLKPEQIIERDRELLDGREVDILLPDFHVGIEYNGLYWHNIEHKPDINYHRDKMLLANSKGYRLIQIFEDEWLEHREIVLNKLRHVINADMGEPTIYARKCVIREINKQIANDFLNAYHIQGFVGSSLYLGAYHNDELVGVMSFKEEKPMMWNLTRYATKTDYKLPGLASKMFKYFTKNYEFNEVKSFLDLRWNQSLNGNTVYDKLGFELTEVQDPDYRYVVDSQRIHKFNMRKQTLNKKYGLPLTMTEREMCDKLGFIRIYDCGLAKYAFKKKEG